LDVVVDGVSVLRSDVLQMQRSLPPQFQQMPIEVLYPVLVERLIDTKLATTGAVLHVYPSEMALNFWTALFAWTGCFVATLLISLLTKRTKTDDELRGLVHSLTPRQRDGDMPWYKRPVTLAVGILVVSTILNIIFW